MASSKIDLVTSDVPSPKFILSDLMNLLCYTSQTKFDPKKLSSMYVKKLEMPLVDFLKRNPLMAVGVQDFCKVPFLSNYKIRLSKVDCGTVCSLMALWH